MRVLALIVLVTTISLSQGTTVVWQNRPVVAGGGGPTSVSDTVDANNRDGQSNGAADEELTATPYSTAYVHWGLYDGAERRAGFQFAIPLAQGTVADSAFLYLYNISGTADEDDSTFVKIEDSDNAAVFDAAHAHSLTAHGGGVWTGGQVVWMTSTWTGGFNKSPDVSTLVNHVFARGGWSSDNYMSLILDYGTTWTGDQHGAASDFNDSGNPERKAYIVVWTH